MRAQYSRFEKDAGVMGPGRAANTLTRATIHSSPNTPRDEVMDEILVGDIWVKLTATRRAPDGKWRKFARYVHAARVVDFDPDEEAPLTDDPTAPAQQPRAARK